MLMVVIVLYSKRKWEMTSAVPMSELPLSQENLTLDPIFVFLLETINPLRSGMGAQWTGWTMISTLWEYRTGVVQVKMPVSSFWAWKMLSRYSSWSSLPLSVAHPSGYFLFPFQFDYISTGFRLDQLACLIDWSIHWDGFELLATSERKSVLNRRTDGVVGSAWTPSRGFRETTGMDWTRRWWRRGLIGIVSEWIGANL